MKLKVPRFAFLLLLAAALSQQVRSDVKTKNLVAGYRFEETSGSNAADMSGNGNTGTVAGTSTIVTGHTGRGRSFAGAGEIDAPDTVALRLSAAYTIAIWVNPTTLPTTNHDQVLIEKDDNSGNANYRLTIDRKANCGSGLAFQGGFQDSGSIGYNDCYYTAITTGTWYFVAGTWDGTNWILYVNGVAVVTNNFAGFTPTTGDGALTMGNEAGNSQNLKGVLDEARVYNRALSPAEIRALMLGYEPSEF